jgi:(1->4)-alpha-D-glucan 1-alpha-D-glucosylmutase
MLTTSTHDTKRSEDVRARMIAISEFPDVWRRSLNRWRTVNRRWKQRLDEMEAPDANEEYLLYQTLLGTWPIDHAGVPANRASGEYIERIQNYMAKALNEAKLNTSWVQPNETWLSAMSDFVSKLLDPSAKNKFLPLFLPVAEEIARIGAVNSLTQTLLKLTAPGVPDIYEGNETWDLSLVDPDNRRPVDFKLRQEMLDSLSKVQPAELLQHWPDGRIKMFLTQRLLRFRRDHPDIFRDGNYLPIGASGTFASCTVSFAREHDHHWVVVIAPRLVTRLGFPPTGEKWQDTALELPEALLLETAHDIFTGREVGIANRRINLGEALSALPFAALTNLPLGN